MDHAYINTLIKALEASNLSELEFSQDGCTLRLVKGASARKQTAAVASSASTSASPKPSVPGAPPAPPIIPRATAEVRAPMFGIVHLQAVPGAPAYVEIGQPIKAGQTLCVIEAMKIFNEIHAEEDCIVNSIQIQSGQEVEAGQVLFQLTGSAADV